MSNAFDVSLRFGIDYRRDEAREIRRDLEELQKAAARFGAEGSGRTGKSFDDAGQAAERAKRQVEGLAAAEDRLKQTDGAQALGRHLMNVERSSDQVRERLGILRRSVDELGDAPGARELSEAIDRLGGRAEKAEGSIDGVRDSVRRLGRETGADELRQDLGQVESAARQAERSIEKMSDAERRLGGGRFGGVRARYGAGARDFGSEVLGSTGGGAMFLPMLGGPAAAAGVTVGGAAYGAYKATGQAISLEAAMADVKRQVPEGTNLTPIRTGIMDLSEELGVPKEQLAALVANAAKTGVASNDLIPFARYASKFAIAGDMDQGEAGETIGLLRNQFGVTQDRVPQILDSINYLADRSSTQERSILQFAGRASQNVDIGTFSPEQIAAFGTGFLNVGRAPEVAGTGFNALISRLADASGRARTDKDFRRSLGRLGLGAGEVQDDFNQDSASTILDLLERVKEVPKEQRMRVLRGLGGEEYADDFAQLVGQTDNIRRFLGDAESPAARGSVEASYKIYADTTSQQLARAAESLASLGTELGETFMPAVRDFAEAVARFAGGWADSIRQDRLASSIVEKRIAGEELTDEEKTSLGDEGFSRRVDRTERRVRTGIAVQEAQRAAPDLSELQYLQQNRSNAVSQIGELRDRLKDLPASDPEAQATRRMLEAIEGQLRKIDETLENGFGELGTAGASPISFEGFGGVGQPRIINASYGGGGAPFRSSYAGAPQMDGFAGMSGGGPSANDNARYGVGGTISNPGGAKGEIFDVLSTDFSDPQAFALLGHMEKESGFDPNAWNAKEGAGGLLQWRGNRLANLKAFAADRGMDWRDRKVQAAFVSHEMKTDPYERQRSARFRGATSLEDASAALEDYVRFGDGSGAERLANARSSAREFRSGRASAQYGGSDNVAERVRRGSANHMHGQYGAPGTNLVTVVAPGGAKFTVHKEAAASFQGFIDELEGTGYQIDPKTSGGYNYRTKRGGRSLSQHAYGNAIDINPQTNPMTKELRTDLPSNVSDIAARHGLSWGGDWKSTKDAMHFEWTGIKPDPEVLADAAEARGARSESFAADGWPEDDAKRPVPKPKPRPKQSAASSTGDQTASATATASRQLVTNHHYHGVDPQVMAAKAARQQRRDIAGAEARAMHDTTARVA